MSEPVRTLYLLRHRPDETSSVLRAKELLDAAPSTETAEVILLEGALGSENSVDAPTFAWGGPASTVTADEVLERIFAAEKVFVL